MDTHGSSSHTLLRRIVIFDEAAAGAGGGELETRRTGREDIGSEGSRRVGDDLRSG